MKNIENTSIEIDNDMLNASIEHAELIKQTEELKNTIKQNSVEISELNKRTAELLTSINKCEEKLGTLMNTINSLQETTVSEKFKNDYIKFVNAAIRFFRGNIDKENKELNNIISDFTKDIENQTDKYKSEIRNKTDEQINRLRRNNYDITIMRNSKFIIFVGLLVISTIINIIMIAGFSYKTNVHERCLYVVCGIGGFLCCASIWWLWNHFRNRSINN